MNKKGFTLVELLVVIAILGIITGISIPLVRNVQTSGNNKKYEIYMDGIKTAAKLYTDSYSEDLFGHSTRGCAYISYGDLEKYHLIKDINISNMSCKTKSTKVKVIKYRGKHFYSPYIGCGSKDNSDGGGFYKATVFKPEKLDEVNTACDEFSANIGIRASVEPSTTNNINRYDINIILDSERGINNNPQPNLQYGFSREKNPNVIDGWHQLSFNVSSVEEYEKHIKRGETQFTKSGTISTPGNISGDLYLVIKVNNLQDLELANWKKINSDADNYVYIGPYRIDGDKPIFDSSSKIVSQASDYNTLKPKLAIKVTDAYPTNSKLKMCVSYDSNTCPAINNAKDLSDNSSKFENYDGNKALTKEIAPSFNGSTHSVYVTVADEAGNSAIWNGTYTVSNSFSITYKGNGNTSGSTASNSCRINTNCTLNKNGFTKTGHTFAGWYTAASGGTKYGATTKLTKSITVYAHWTPKTYTISYAAGGGKGSMPSSKCTYGKAISARANKFTRTGYTFNGWNGLGTCTGNKTLTAKWKAKTYTVSYAAGGGKGSMPSSKCTYGKAISARANKFTRTGYTFNGWKGLGKCTGNKTLTAKWKAKK